MEEQRKMKSFECYSEHFNMKIYSCSSGFWNIIHFTSLCAELSSDFGITQKPFDVDCEYFLPFEYGLKLHEIWVQVGISVTFNQDLN